MCYDRDRLPSPLKHIGDAVNDGGTKPARLPGRPSVAVALASVRAVVEEHTEQLDALAKTRAVVEQQAAHIAALIIAYQGQAERLRLVEDWQAEARQELRRLQLQLELLIQQQAH